MGLGSRAFDQQIRGLTPPQVRKSTIRTVGSKGRLRSATSPIGVLQGCFGDLRSTIATDLDAALLRSRQRRLCAHRNHSGRVRQRPLRTQIANAHCEQELSHQLRAAPKIGLQALRLERSFVREKAERAGLCALSPFIRRLARPLSERERDAHCGIAYFVGEHAILDRARQHHTANA